MKFYDSFTQNTIPITFYSLGFKHNISTMILVIKKFLKLQVNFDDYCFYNK